MGPDLNPLRVSIAPRAAVTIKEWGLPVRTDMPEEVYALMDLYPQPTQRPSVQYIPIPYRREVEPRPKGTPAG